jgi:hypothetical protein
MTPALVFVAIAILIAAVFTYLAVRRGSHPLALDDARLLMGTLDMEAFRNLVSPEEDAFLESRLAAPQLKAIKRERALTALAYVRTVSHIALEFSRFGHALRHSSDPHMAELGRELASAAVRLRVRSLELSGRLFIAAAFPQLRQGSPRFLLEQYARSEGLLIRCSLLERARRQASPVPAA